MSLKPLNKISAPDYINYDADSLRDDIISKIQSDPEWNSLWDGELHQNAFQMILELFSYLFERNAKASNIHIKEKFLNQAFSEQSIYDNLADLRIQLLQAKASSAVIRGTPTDTIITEPIVIPRFTSITGKNANGQTIDFEFIYKDPITQKYNYFDNLVINPDINNMDHFDIEVYAGITNNKSYTINESMLENFILEIDNSDIIQDSIRVYYSTSASYPIELPYTESFVVPPAQMPLYFPNGKPHYTVRYNQNGSASILFGTENFGGAFETQHVGNQLNVFYRTGGGAKTNILAGGIKTSLSFAISQNRTIAVDFTNLQNASGGADRESVFKAQVFAPYRYGRGKAIVDTQDAKNKLYNMLVKHEIQSPEYDEVNRDVPLLHAYHKVVYNRNFENFIVPEYISGETLEEYNTRFLAELNDFCNITGIKDQEYIDEEATEFVYPNEINKTAYDHFLTNKYPLSGSLTAYAQDYTDETIDSIIFDSNYVVDYRNGNASLSRTPQTHAELYSNYFSNITILNTFSGRNDLLMFQIDGNIRPYTFSIQLTEGIKTYQMYAIELQNAIVEAIAANAPELFTDAASWQFVDYEELEDNSTQGRIILRSPSVGYNSTIKIIDNGSINEPDTQFNIYAFLGWQVKTYRPAQESGTVFANDNMFYYYSNKMTLNFRDDLYEKNKQIAYNNLGIIIDHNNSNGPLIEIIMADENSKLERLFEGEYPLIITAYNASDQPVDHMLFSTISSESESVGEVGAGDEFSPLTYTPGSIFKDGIENVYDYENAKISLRFIDNEQVDFYDQSYPTIERIDLTRIYEDPVNPGVYLEDSAFPTFHFLEINGNYTQNNTQEAGNICEIVLTTLQQSLLTIGDTYLIKWFHRDTASNLVVVESARIYNLTNGINALSDLPMVEVVVDQGYSSTQYNHTNGTLKFKFLNGTLNPAIIYYTEKFADFAYFKIDYYKKTYETIRAYYRPNIYYPEGEARSILNVLNAKENRMIGLEHLFKSVIFKPFACRIKLIIRKNYSIANAISAAKDYLGLLYYYDNENSEHSIGSIVSQQVIKNTLSKIADQYGIVDIQFLSNEITSDANTINTYQFIIDYSIYEQLNSLEVRYDALSGLTNLYAFEITAMSEGAQ